MLVFGVSSCNLSRCTMLCSYHGVSSVKCGLDNNTSKRKIVTNTEVTSKRAMTIGLVATAGAASMLISVMGSNAVNIQGQLDDETLSNIPQTLSGACVEGKDCRKARIQKPKSRKAESCTIKCVTTCIRGGDGSPGEGPLNVRKPLVVFRQGFRSRQYCLVECSDICNLIKDGEDGP